MDWVIQNFFNSTIYLAFASTTFSVQYWIRGTTIIQSVFSPSSGPYEQLLEIAFAIGGERMRVMYHY